MPPRSRNAAAKRAADPFPDTLSPQLATLVSKPPARGDWVYEIKLDGYRILARCEVGKAPAIYAQQGDAPQTSVVKLFDLSKETASDPKRPESDARARWPVILRSQ